MLLIIFAVAVGAGISLLVFGLIGSRSGDEPRCGQCEYDLRGAAIDADCPECGASHAQRQTGLRRPRRQLVMVGAVLLAIAAAGGWGPVRTWALAFDHYTILPSWVLQRRVERDVIEEFVRDGGIFIYTIGCDRSNAGRSLFSLPRP